MRITMDLPDEMLKRAKAAAIERGVTLRQFMTDALNQALASTRKKTQQIKLPSIRLDANAPLWSMGIEDLKSLEAEEEAHHLRAVYRGVLSKTNW